MNRRMRPLMSCGVGEAAGDSRPLPDFSTSPKYVTDLSLRVFAGIFTARSYSCEGLIVDFSEFYPAKEILHLIIATNVLALSFGAAYCRLRLFISGVV